MPDITTADLVTLAEYCGKEGIKVSVGKVWVNAPENAFVTGRVGRTRWNPPEDAAQRDELVDAFRKDGWEVIQSTCPGQKFPYECEMGKEKDGKPAAQSRAGYADTPGMAFCVPALQAIKPKENESD